MHRLMSTITGCDISCWYCRCFFVDTDIIFRLFCSNESILLRHSFLFALLLIFFCLLWNEHHLTWQKKICRMDSGFFLYLISFEHLVVLPLYFYFDTCFTGTRFVYCDHSNKSLCDFFWFCCWCFTDVFMFSSWFFR